MKNSIVRYVLLPAGLALGIFVFGCAEPGVDRADAASADLKKELTEILKKNPDIVLDVLRDHNIEAFDIVNEGLQAKRKRDSEQELKNNLANPLKPAIDPTRPFFGASDAPYTIVEYSDFLCPYCGRAAKTVKDLVKKHPGKFRVFFKHVPLHKHSRIGALYFEALSLQSSELAWKFNDMSFEKAQEINKDGEAAYKRFVDAIPGIDKERLKKDLKNPMLGARVDADMAEAKRFKITGTPYFTVNGILIRGAQPVAKFESVVEQIEKNKK